MNDCSIKDNCPIRVYRSVSNTMVQKVSPAGRTGSAGPGESLFLHLGDCMEYYTCSVTCMMHK